MHFVHKHAKAQSVIPRKEFLIGQVEAGGMGRVMRAPGKGHSLLQHVFSLSSHLLPTLVYIHDLMEHLAWLHPTAVA